jgi:hypothetical protein
VGGGGGGVGVVVFLDYFSRVDKFYSALDKALMKFHAMKMSEINTVLRELWQSTYKGLSIVYSFWIWFDLDLV